MPLQANILNISHVKWYKFVCKFLPSAKKMQFLKKEPKMKKLSEGLSLLQVHDITAQ